MSEWRVGSDRAAAQRRERNPPHQIPLNAKSIVNHLASWIRGLITVLFFIAMDPGNKIV